MAKTTAVIAKTCECGCGQEVASGRSFRIGHNMRGRRETLEQFAERFWSHVDPPDAHGHRMWSGATEEGYGIFQMGATWGKRTVKAHRVALWLSSDGALELDGPWHGLHDCDTPGCCEPAHLLAADHTTNMRQMVERGRAPRAENHNWGRLTREQVAEIRRRKQSGDRAVDIAADFGIVKQYVWMICSGAKRPNG